MNGGAGLATRGDGICQPDLPVLVSQGHGIVQGRRHRELLYNLMRSLDVLAATVLRWVAGT
jgi:hypothetical protein